MQSNGKMKKGNLDASQITRLPDYPITNFLQILFRPALNPVQRFVQVLHGIGDREAQVAFSKRPERRTGEAGHAGIVEQRLSQLARFPSCLLDVGKCIKSAMRQPATEAGNLV